MSAVLGWHLIAELDGCARWPDGAAVEALLGEAARAGHARLLSVHVHAFGGHGGVAGVALLAESHVSLHTWPEFGYAAVDVFMCGPAADPDAALAVLVRGLGARETRVQRLGREPGAGRGVPSA